MDPFASAALHEALASVDDGGGPFGAVVVRGDRIVGRGRNRVVPAADPTAHAEVEAIRAACRALGTHVLDGCTLYASCEPCPMCLGAALWARVERVRYLATSADAAAAGFDDAAFYLELTLPRGERRLPLERVDTRGATEPFERWSARPDHARY